MATNTTRDIVSASGGDEPLVDTPDGYSAGASGPFGWAQNSLRGVQRGLARHATARSMLAVPRTARFVAATAVRHTREAVPGLPVPSISPALTAQVAMDEMLLALAIGPDRQPSRADYERVSAELTEMRDIFRSKGWIDDPASYHDSPPALIDPAITTGWALGQGYKRLLFNSGWEALDTLPGSARWMGYKANRTASATILEHTGEPRPWVIALHGFGCGYPFMDFIGLHAIHLHRDLGLNVAMPVLPMHASRKQDGFSGEEFLSFDLVNTVHGLTQAMWDIRRTISWVRGRGAPKIGVYGVSLGGYVSSLLTTLEDGLDCVIAGIPVVDFVEMLRHQSSPTVRARALAHGILGGTAEEVHRVVSPLAMETRVPHEGRFIFGGLGDRMAPPTQAHALWKHWDEPEVLWYGGNHVGYLWSKQVTRFIGDSLRAQGFVEPA